MYTQCPECQTAFRVTVKVLQKASGRVRCGGCEHAFSALDYLSDGVPGTASNPSSSEREASNAADTNEDFDTKSKALLETLDELAGKQDIRIEDTGVEWRVLNEDGLVEDEVRAPNPVDNNEPVADDDSAAELAERRYDDDTELPDDFADEEDKPFVPETPQRRTTDSDEQLTDFDTHQVDLALDGDETWAQLFDDEDDGEPAADATDSADDLAQQLEAAEARQIADDSALLPQLAESLIQEAQSNDGKIPFDVEVELAAIHSDVAAISNSAMDSDPEDLDSQFNTQAEELGLDITHNSALDVDEADDEQLDTAADDSEIAAEDQTQDEKLVAEEAADEQLNNALLTDADGDDIDNDDELSAEEEAAIVQKLRDSTGSFQKQIQAAQNALDTGDIDELEEQIELESESGDALIEAAEGDDSSDAIIEETAEDTLSQTMIRAGIDPSVLDADNSETIVMEGDFVHDLSSEQAESTAENESISGLGDQRSLVDTYMLNKGQMDGKGRSEPINWGMLGGIAALLFILAAQYVHASRQTFATYGAFNQTIGPVYRALGNAVTPRWNIKGWQFERTSGSTDDSDEVLTVFSTVRNNSQQPLPYPLVHLSLTDRWEDIIGSKILEPGDYLAGDMDPRTPVAPGDSFTAVISIERPSVEATGFQLYVCYRVGPGRVRCATEDFKE